MRDPAPPGFAAYYAAVQADNSEGSRAMTLEWISTGNGEWETPDGWWVGYDDACRVWQFGFQDMAMGWSETADDAKAECERMERNSR